MASSPPLEIRLLGEQAVSFQGRPRPLPPSRKARALLAYLAVTAREHRRERLCGMLWDVADDPRGALRWCLSKLRHVVDDASRRRLRADRERVALDLSSDVAVDVIDVKRRALGLEGASTAELEATLALFRGEFLEGLELTDFPGFHAWCVAERQELGRVRARTAALLLERAGAGPEHAVAVARHLIELDPSDAAAGARLLELLRASGPTWSPVPAGARAGPEPGVVTLPAEHATAVDPEHEPSPGPARRELPRVGRGQELARIGALLEDRTRGVHALFLAGDPGIGKSTLLDLARAEARARGIPAFTARARELEAGWPFAPWLDIVRAGPGTELDPDLAAALAPLLETGPGGAPGGAAAREGVLRGVATLLRRRADTAGRLLLALDDVQWLDESSAALLCFVAADARARPLRVLLAGRPGELADNPAALRALRALRREGLLEELAVGPLSREEIASLVDGLPGAADPAGLFAESGGNPLYALELARAPPAWSEVPRGLAQVVRDRLASLEHPLADLLRWASALGPTLEPELLAAAVALAPGELVSSLEALERHGFLMPAPAPAAEASAYAFSHDVVRRAVYDDVSEPRRRLMHARVAAVLAARPGADGVAAAALAHHAVLGGDLAMAARACLAAGTRCLRLFAAADAAALARRGLSYAEKLPDPERTTLGLDLHHLSFQARRPSEVEGEMAELSRLTRRALELGAVEHARLGCYLRAVLMWEEGQPLDVERYSREAEQVSRSSPPAERVVGLGEAAHCLVTVERDLPHAEAMLLEAQRPRRAGGDRLPVVPLADGQLRLHRGELDRAGDLFEQARALARRGGDRLREFYAVEGLATLALERGRLAEASALAEALVPLGERSREGSEAPFARALLAVVELARGGDPRAGGLDTALQALVAADAKHRAAILLTRTARIELARGAAGAAAVHAAEALRLAESIDTPSEIAAAAAALHRAARAAGRPDEVERARGALAAVAGQPISAAARRALEEEMGEGGHARPASQQGRGHGARRRGARV